MKGLKMPSHDRQPRPFFVFAGLNGCGKSTLIQGVSHRLRDMGVPVDVTKAYSAERKAADEVFMSTADDVEILMLFQAFFRRQYCETTTSLDSGNVVLADRWRESYEEYHSQYGILSKNPAMRTALGELAFGDLTPRKTFYVNLDPQIALDRLNHRGMDFFDAQPAAKHMAQARYYDMRSRSDDTWVTVDGTLSPSDLADATTEIILQSGLSATDK